MEKNKQKKLLADAAMVSSTAATMVGAQALDNNVKGYIAPIATTGAGIIGMIYAPKWAKPASAVALGFGVLSGAKKLFMKPDVIRTGLLQEVEFAMPGNLLISDPIEVAEGATQDKLSIGDRLKKGIQKVKLSLGMNGMEDPDYLANALAGGEYNLEQKLAGESSSDSLMQALEGVPGMDLESVL